MTRGVHGGPARVPEGVPEGVPDGVPEPAWSRPAVGPVVQGRLAACRTLTVLHTVGAVGSTQDVALTLGTEGAPHGTVVVADRQLAGRGRSGRRWDDLPDGGTLALTVLLDADRYDPSTLPLLPHALGLAVVDAGRAVLPVGAAEGLRLKWPNDVVVRPAAAGDGPGAVRKLAGVLVEREQVHRTAVAPSGPRDVLLCGVGIDVDLRGGGEAPDRTCLAALASTAPDGSPDAPPAGSPDRGQLLAAVIAALDGALVALGEDPAALLSRYREVSDTLGRRVRVELPDGSAVVGTATAVADDGRLEVTTDGRTRAILSGTVRDHGVHDQGVRDHVASDDEEQR